MKGVRGRRPVVSRVKEIAGRTRWSRETGTVQEDSAYFEITLYVDHEAILNRLAGRAAHSKGKMAKIMGDLIVVTAQPTGGKTQ